MRGSAGFRCFGETLLTERRCGIDISVRPSTIGMCNEAGLKVRVFRGHFAKKRTTNPILCLLSYSLNGFKKESKLTPGALIVRD